MTPQNRLKKPLLAAVAALTIAGCAAVVIPPAQLASTEASIRGAQEMGAEGLPAAKLHLQLARDQTDAAKKMASSGDRRAVLVLARAESDAELALGLARENSVHVEATKASQDLAAVNARSAP